MRIGVLAVQGAFIEHEQLLHRLDVETFQIRQANHLKQKMDALIIPGGESTVMGKLLNELHMLLPLREMINRGLPTMGTCAGLILLAARIENPTDGQLNLGTMDITVKRNAYGRQLGSFRAIEDFAGKKNVPMTFIRAPYITEIGPNVEILASTGGHIVAARQAKQLVMAFHPELTADTRIHEYFLNCI